MTIVSNKLTSVSLLQTIENQRGKMFMHLIRRADRRIERRTRRSYLDEIWKKNIILSYRNTKLEIVDEYLLHRQKPSYTPAYSNFFTSIQIGVRFWVNSPKSLIHKDIM